MLAYVHYLLYLCRRFMAGIYIHIPFCKSRCRYCDFFSTTQLERREDYAHAIIAEFNDRRHLLSEPIHTIYFGGGTPSVFGNERLKEIIELAKKKGALKRALEVEEIPDSIYEELKTYVIE